MEDKPGRVKHHRRRGWRRLRTLVARLLFLLLLLFASVIVTAWLLLQNQSLAEFALEEALPRVNAMLPGRIELGGFEGSLGDHLILNDVVVYDERDGVAARIPRAEIWWDVWDLAQQQVAVSRIDITRPEVLVDLRADGTLNWVGAFVKATDEPKPKKAAKSSPLRIQLDQVNVTGAQVELNVRDKQRFEFGDIDLRGTYALERGLHDIEVRELGVKVDAPWDLPRATLTAEAQLDDLDLNLKALRLELADSVVTADGRITQLNNLRFESFGVQSSRFDLELLKRLSPKIPLQKAITLDVTLDGKLDALALVGEIGGEVGRIGLSDVLVGVKSKPLTHKAILDVDGLKLADLLPYPGLPPAITADIRWDGQGTNLGDLVGDAAVDAEAFDVQDVHVQGHELRAHIEDGVVTASHVERVGGGRIAGDATVWLTEGRFDVQRTRIEGVNLAAFTTVSRRSVRGGITHGWIEGRGSWAERPLRFEADGETRVKGLQVPSTTLATAKASFQDLVITLEPGAPSLTGTIQGHGTGVVVNGTEQVREVTLTATAKGQTADFETVVNRGTELLTELDGAVDWSLLPTLKLRGDRLQILAGTLLATTPEGQPFTFKTRGGALQLDRLQLEADDLRLTAQGSFDPRGAVAAQVRLTGMDLGPTGPLVDVLPLLPEGPRAKVEALGLSGEVRELFGRIAGSLADPELELRLAGNDLVAMDRPPLALDLTATLDDAGLVSELSLDTLVDVSIKELPASLSFAKGEQLLTLDPEGAWNINVSIPDTSLGRVAALAKQELPEAIVSGVYSGGVNWTGTTANPEIRGALSVADVKVEARKDASSEPVTRAVNAKAGAAVSDGRLELVSSFLRTNKEGRILSLDGGADAPLGEFLLARFGPDADPSAATAPFKALGLGATVKNLPMQLVHVFVPALAPLTGSATGKLMLAGELDAPEGSVDLQLIGGRAGTQELKTARVAVQAMDDRLTLDVALEAKDGGDLGAQGGVTFPIRRGSDFKTLLDHDDLAITLGGEGFPIAVLLAFVPHTYDVSGALGVSGDVTGSLRNPVPNVSLRLPEGRLCHEKTWICYEKVHLDAAVVPGRLTVTDASFKTFPRSRNPLATRTWNQSDKAAGGFALSGFAELEGFNPALMDFEFDFDHMWVSSDETKQVQIDGGIGVNGLFPALAIAGEVDLENVVIDLGHDDLTRSLAPTQLPENLRVHRVETRRGPGERKPSLVDRSNDPSRAREILEALDVDVAIRLGNNVKVKLARGIADEGPAKVFNTVGRVEPDMVLTGDVRVLMANLVPKLEGRIETNRGSRLTALTKKFLLEDGSGVDFIGDPLASQLGLTGVHTTRYGDVRVKVTGSVQKPQIVFESDEFDDQADIMALLVTGKPLSELTAAQGSSAMSGVGAALTGWASNTFGKYLPVDLLEVDLGDDFSSGSVEAGKAITPWLFLISRFRWGAEDDENTIEGQVELAFPGTRNLYLEVILGDRLVGSAELIFKVLY